MIIRKLILVIAISWIVKSRREQIKISNKDLMIQQTKIKYITKFNVGYGVGKFKFKARSVKDEDTEKRKIMQINVGILNSQNLLEYQQKRTCEQKISVFSDTHKLELGKNYYTFQIKQQKNEGYYYVYVFNCDLQNIETQNTEGTVSFYSWLLNNDSQFGQNQNLFVQYTFCIILWVYFACKYTKSILYVIRNSQYNSKMILYFGFYSMIVYFFYRFLDLIIIYSTGLTIWVFPLLSEIIKCIIEGIMISIMISVAFGWSITTLDTNRVGILFGIVMTILNIICSIYDAQDNQQVHHYYDKKTLPLILFCRLSVAGILFFGARQSMSRSVGKIKFFFNDFSIWASLYLLGWPLGFLICQLFLPEYKHRQFLILVENCLHVIGNSMMCRSFSVPTSQYRKIQKQKLEQFQLPD